MCRPCSLNDKTFEYEIVGRQINSMKAFFLKWYFFAQMQKYATKKIRHFKIRHQKICHFKIRHFKKLKHLCENLQDS